MHLVVYVIILSIGIENCSCSGFRALLTIVVFPNERGQSNENSSTHLLQLELKRQIINRAKSASKVMWNFLLALLSIPLACGEAA
jgi:hypothetical protein